MSAFGDHTLMPYGLPSSFILQRVDFNIQMWGQLAPGSMVLSLARAVGPVPHFNHRQTYLGSDAVAFEDKNVFQEYCLVS